MCSLDHSWSGRADMAGKDTDEFASEKTCCLSRSGLSFDGAERPVVPGNQVCGAGRHSDLCAERPERRDRRVAPQARAATTAKVGARARADLEAGHEA